MSDQYGYRSFAHSVRWLQDGAMNYIVNIDGESRHVALIVGSRPNPPLYRSPVSAIDIEDHEHYGISRDAAQLQFALELMSWRFGRLPLDHVAWKGNAVGSHLERCLGSPVTVEQIRELWGEVERLWDVSMGEDEMTIVSPMLEKEYAHTVQPTEGTGVTILPRGFGQGEEEQL